MSSIDKRGVRDWWLQRLSAWLILLYVPVLMVWIAIQRPSSYQEWAVLFSPIVMKILATLALLGVVVHAAIGFWVVATDYIKCDRARKVATILMHVLITGSALVLGIMLWMV
mgnify:CR=1 FL=1